jgi:hypothetical protein
VNRKIAPLFKISEEFFGASRLPPFEFLDHEMTQLTNGKVLERAANKSERLLERARQSIAAGDNSTMRVLPYSLPMFVTRGEVHACGMPTVRNTSI